MKKISLYIVLFGFVALIAACVQPLDPGLKEQPGKYTLNLSVRCVDPATKAVGVETLHENTITTLDWFIFTSNGNDARAILHDRSSYTNKANVTEPFTVTSQDMEPYIDPSTKTLTGYVYILANLPATFTHAALAAKTLGELKQLEVSTTLDILDSNGKFKAQDNFVMASSTSPISGRRMVSGQPCASMYSSRMPGNTS